MDYTLPYLRCRAAGMVPALLASTSFTAYRGLLNTVLPLRVSLTTNLLNLALDPLFIFGLGRGGAATPLLWCGVPLFLSNGSGPCGAAAATSVAELALAPCIAS
jgi:Na+-driven multidrug efflux pump